MRWALPVAVLAGAVLLPVGAAQAAGSATTTCATSTLKDRKLSTAAVTICRDPSGTVTSVSGSVTDLNGRDRRCARLDILQMYGDPDLGEYVNRIEVACDGTATFDYRGGWVKEQVQLSLVWVAGS